MKRGRDTCVGGSMVVVGAITAACAGGGTPTAEAPAGADTATAKPAAADEAAGKPTAEPSGAGDSQPAAKAGPPEPWKGMGAEKRKTYMTDAVLPKMGPEFTSFDGERYANVTCKTCHGAGADKGTFAMPNPKLAKLPPGGNLQAVLKDDPAVANFMMRNVVPNMVELLGVEAYDPESGAGFGCYSCHGTK